MKAFHHMSLVIVVIGVLGLFLCGFSKKAKAYIIMNPSYQFCMDSCLDAYGNIDMYYTCQQYCVANPVGVIVVPNYGFYRRGHYPRHEGGEHHNRGR